MIKHLSESARRAAHVLLTFVVCTRAVTHVVRASPFLRRRGDCPQSRTAQRKEEPHEGHQSNVAVGNTAWAHMKGFGNAHWNLRHSTHTELQRTQAVVNRETPAGLHVPLVAPPSPSLTWKRILSLNHDEAQTSHGPQYPPPATQSVSQCGRGGATATRRQEDGTCTEFPRVNLRSRRPRRKRTATSATPRKGKCSP